MKYRVKESFSKAVEEYDRYAIIQQQAGKRLLERLRLIKRDGSILDLGAGTGVLLKGFKNTVALDLSLPMCRSCKKQELLPVAGDGEFLPFKSGVFDVVFSNFALQWMVPERVAPEVYRVLKLGGLAFISLPVEESLSRLLSAWNRAHIEVFGEEDVLFRFPSENRVLEAFKRAGFKLLEFERKEFSIWFDSPREAVRCVNRVGARNPFRKSKTNRELVKKFYEFYSLNGKFLLNYKVLFLVLKRI